MNHVGKYLKIKFTPLNSMMHHISVIKIFLEITNNDNKV